MAMTFQPATQSLSISLPHAILASVLLLASPVPAQAGDACVVGKWQPQGDAAAEWMRRNAPGVNVSTANRRGALEFRADGRYAAAGSGDAQASSGTARASANNLQFQAQGTWSTERGSLILRPSQEAMRGTMKIQGPNGRTIEMPMPSGPAQPQKMQYTCSGDTLETQLPIPNATPIVQRYRRLR